MTALQILWLVVAIVCVLALAGIQVTATQALLVFLLVYALGGTGLIR